MSHRRHRARTLGASLLACLLASYALLSPSCSTWDGHFTVGGYSTRPNYDMRFRTVSVPIFKNRTFWTATPVPGMEMDLTRALVREIEQKTPYKVVQDNSDTQITGNFDGWLNINQGGEYWIREIKVEGM